MPLYMDGNNVSVFSKLIVEGGSGGGTITAINKTGSTINEGDKVWINKLNIEANSEKNFNYSRPTYLVNFISPDGNSFFSSGYLYSITTDSLLQISNTTNYTNYSIPIIEENKIFGSENGYLFRTDYPNNWSDQKRIGHYVGNNITYDYNNRCFHKIDVNTGDILYSSTTINDNYGFKHFIMIDNILYSLCQNLTVKITDTSSSLEIETGTYNQRFSNSFNPFGITIDKKYILAVEYSYNNRFSILKFDNETKTITNCNIDIEFPDIYEYINTNVSVFWNPNNQILSIAKEDGDGAYGIFKYENGTFVKIPFELPETISLPLESAISIPNDFDKIMVIPNYTYPNFSGKIIFTQENKGMVAHRYAIYNNSINTVTGKATTSAEPNEIVNVSTIL